MSGGFDPRAVTGDFSAAGDFFGSIMAGFLLGLGLDWVFSTRPLFVVLGIVLGSVSGFLAMYRFALRSEEREAQRRRHTDV